MRFMVIHRSLYQVLNASSTFQSSPSHIGFECLSLKGDKPVDSIVSLIVIDPYLFMITISPSCT